MKFLVDMPLSPQLARWLADNGHDAVHALEIGLDRAPDSEIVGVAKREERVIVTADLDFPRLLALAGASGPGLILFRGGAWCDEAIIARMNALLNSFDDVDFIRNIFVVDGERVRRRKLPIDRS